MITVGGFNTSVDKAMTTDELAPGAVVRVRDVRATPGGKGVHVAQAAAALGEPVCLVGLVDAAHRALFDDTLGARGVTFDPVPSPAPVRSCLAIHDRGGARVTEILEPGPQTDAPTREALGRRFLARAARSTVAVLSGSLPPGFGHAAYAELVGALASSPVRVLVDASGGALSAAAAARPHLVKPNREEAEALTGRAIEGPAAAVKAARAIRERGPAVVLLSIGAAGAVAVAEGRAAHAWVHVDEVKTTVGSGDCLLGGVAVALARGASFEDVLRLGVACGAANAMSGETGFFARADVEALLPKVELTSL
ncbi:MAG TPA: hexose kinase [Vicinamibacteria bacterium]